MNQIKTVSVIGASGTMGANIAGIFASFGNAKVYCIGRDIDKVKKTVPCIVKSVRAEAITDNIIPADISMLEDCVKQSDMVFESGKEDLEFKMNIAKRVGEVLPTHAISGTGTSGLSVTKLAECYPEDARRRFFGIHFFNPPYTLPLCELIPTVYSDEKIRNNLKEYLDRTLNRTVVEVKDSPAFLGNRIGFQFINEAIQYADRYKDNGGVDYIDSLLGTFTGRSMAPIVTADFVGLDVHKAIVDNIYENTADYAKDTFMLPDYVQRLIDEGRLGRKSGEGLYKLVRYDNGLKRQTVYDIKTGAYRDVISYEFPFADEMKRLLREGEYEKAFEKLIDNRSQEAEICLSFLVKYILYSMYCTEEVGFSVESADDCMAAGFNWCPPLAMYDALSSIVDVKLLVRERIPEICKKIDVDRYLTNLEPSKYDYRRFFKSGR